MRDDHPVIVAAGAGDPDRLAELLAAEPDSVNVRGWMGTTPLIAATWQADSAAAVRLLLERGADPLAVRTNGDGALHWAASGEVAAVLAAAAGPAGLAARYLFDQTPLHVAVEKGHGDVVRALLAAGADTGALDSHGHTPLDTAGDPHIARLLVEAGAPHRTGGPSTPLHGACRRAASDEDWVPVVELLLERGADPGLRDEFGALPSDLVGGAHGLRDRLVAMVVAAGRAVELGPGEVAAGRQLRVAIRPDRPEALTTMFSGTVLVRWGLAPVTPVEVVHARRRKPVQGPYGAVAGPALAFADNDSVWLRDWAGLRSRAVARELLPDDLYAHPVLSPDGRHLVVPACESLRVIDLGRGEVTGEQAGLGDWSVVPRFTPDGTVLAVGSSMQGTWWLTVFALTADGSLQRRHERRDGLPSGPCPEIVTDLAHAPDGRRFATWVRPDHGRAGPGGYRGLVATTWTHSGEPAWHAHVDDALTGHPGGAVSASLCFTPDASWLAVGLDSGVLWLDADSGAPGGHDHTTGAVNALASHPAVGVLAATDHGLRRIEPPAR
jgi:hypothetical protein